MITNKKFTKGEWKVKFIDLADFGVAAVHNDEKVIAQCNLNGRLSEETKENAKLIAAAPELLEACEKALDTLENENIFGQVRLLLAVSIKKATE